MRAPLSEHEYIEVAREFGSSVVPMVMVPFIELLVEALSDKLKNQESPAASAAKASVLMQAGN
jgi:hypothetical protein